MQENFFLHLNMCGDHTAGIILKIATPPKKKKETKKKSRPNYISMNLHWIF